MAVQEVSTTSKKNEALEYSIMAGTLFFLMLTAAGSGSSDRI